MCYCPTPTLHLNLALTGDGAFLFSPKKTHSVWFIRVLNYGDTENVLINHLLLVIPMSYPCNYTNLCPHKPHKHAHRQTDTQTHTHRHTHTQTHTDTHAWTQTQAHTRRHTDTHTHTHTPCCLTSHEQLPPPHRHTSSYKIRAAASYLRSFSVVYCSFCENFSCHLYRHLSGFLFLSLHMRALMFTWEVKYIYIYS